LTVGSVTFPTSSSSQPVPASTATRSPLAGQAKDAADLHAESHGHRRARAPQQPGEIVVLERLLTQCGDGGLLGQKPLELGLGTPALGDVARDAVNLGQLARVVGDAPTARLGPDEAVILVAQAEAHRPRAGRLEDLAVDVAHELDVVGMDELEAGPALELARVEAEEAR